MHNKQQRRVYARTEPINRTNQAAWAWPWLTVCGSNF